MSSETQNAIRTVAMVLAGGRVGELSVLTMERPKAALPFGGYFRIIDFALSNLMHAGLTKVGILSQYRPASLIEHVGTGESWDFVGLDRGAKILPPFWGGDAGDWYRGNADAVEQNWNFINDAGADLLLIVSGDHIHDIDYQDVIRTHLEKDADMTICFKSMDHDPSYGFAKLGPDGHIADYREKPDEPFSEYASLTTYVINVPILREVFKSREGKAGELLEFGRHVIPYMVDKYKMYGYVHDGYWAYTRTVPMYYAAHQDLISGLVDIEKWGIRTNLQDTLVADQPPARFSRTAEVTNSLISTGCEIEGEVINSVLSPGVRVGKGARIVDSILCHNTVVGEDVRVYRTISDKHVQLGSGTVCGGEETEDNTSITLIGKLCEIGARVNLTPGAALPPEQRVPDGARVEGRS